MISFVLISALPAAFDQWASFLYARYDMLLMSAVDLSNSEEG